ncbi:xanthine permease family protein [[Clostridium] bifermentans ATCC 638]|uniref:Xanthine permease family protein n=1 Tax=Paraclostridium bifermentans ATCC 638 = DSM 14991 TaxID=1233171 RepID=T4VQ36_PARBF|nr:nucleobase:cation symporter-2 family protein [Paraclostridium bifermentans]EQK43230.1 xanthine permease family protein [[Clostridium] bifermentans ATCC 638] [Paraclostridium bifermentans ATCC 638 = DSM 14991]RIZ60453.1 purine permease [Paraclostridium bifermentans]UAG17095.1 purine permease [Paraclostridium bifermentans]
MSENSSSQKIKNQNNSGLLYRIEDRPNLQLSILLGFQHIVAAFGGIVAVPLVIGPAIGVDVRTTAMLVSATIFVAGLATIIQARGIYKIGAKLPCIMGTSFTFVGPAITVGTSMGLAGIFGATILGSFIEMILSRFIKPLMKFFPPVVTGTVVTLIGLTLVPVSMDWCAGGIGSPTYGSITNICIALMVMVIVVGFNIYGKGVLSSSSILIGMFVGYLACIPIGLVDFTPIKEASWIGLPGIPVILEHGIKFSLAGVAPFIIAYLVTTIETVGCLIAIGEASDIKTSSEQLSKGVLADGLGSFLAGFFGVCPNTTFSQNIGLIPITKVASRHVVIISGVIMMLLGIFPKLGALVASIPSPVLGGAGIVMFGVVAASGIKTLSKVNINNRNLIIISVSIALGLGITTRPELLTVLPESLKLLFGSGISTGTIFAVMLNILLKDTE